MTVDLADVPERLRGPVGATLTAVGIDNGHISVELVDEQQIRELNRSQRGRDEVTDVLSFPIDGRGPAPGPRELGDVVICPRRADDLIETVIHGVLHLCGYDHETDEGEMLRLQARLRAGFDTAAAGSDEHRRRLEVASSLDAKAELFDVFEQLFADLDQLGASSTDVVELLESAGVGEGGRALDLGCGKGAVAVALAQRLGLRVLGVDALPAFVESARERASRAGVQERCEFEHGDIRDWLEPELPFDLVLLLALGDLLGDAAQTVGRVRSAVRPGGLIVIDDAYFAEGEPAPPGYESYAGHAQTRQRLESWGDRVIGEAIDAPGSEATANRRDTELLRGRAGQLAAERPELTPALDRFIAAQESETHLAETSVIGAVWLLRRSS